MKKKYLIGMLVIITIVLIVIMSVKDKKQYVYKITVENPGHISKGVSKIYVDGNEISGTVVPVFNDDKEHEVRVIMG